VTVNVWLPAAAPPAFQERAKLASLVELTRLPSQYRATLPMAMEPVADPVTWTALETVDPEVGDEIVTDGGAGLAGGGAAAAAATALAALTRPYP
jgi:hypothetical protein